MTCIENARVVLPDGVLESGTVVFDRVIRSIGQEPCPDVVCRIDGEGLVLCPGFIDTHTHGCGGDDTFDGGDAVLRHAKRVVRTGTTSFLPTTITGKVPQLDAALDAVRAAMTASPGGARVLGAHVEGPFISPAYKGAHDERYILAPDWNILESYADIVRIVTVAPELDGAAEFIRTCTQVGVHISLGHTAATAEQCRAALDGGADSFTHVYNGMPPLHHRNPGVVGAALCMRDAYAELICDNIHVHPLAQETLYRARQGENIVLITDSMRACLMGDGTFTLGSQEVTVKDGQARLRSGTLAGSVLTMNRAVVNFAAAVGIPFTDAVRYASEIPARRLGLTRKGRIAPGLDADLVLLDDSGAVRYTFVEGEKVYDAQDPL